jgi:hypothetical protein
MPTIHVEAEVSTRELLQAVEQLSPAELEQFVAQVNRLRVRRQVPRSAASEAELLATINEGLPEALRQRSKELIAKRHAETLTPEEYSELLRLTEEVEQREARRVHALVDLARLRQLSLDGLMSALGMQAPADD